MTVDKSKFLASVKKRGSYTIIPNELFRAPELDVYDKVIWSHIVSQSPKWAASIGNISRNIGIDERTVSKRIKKLSKLNLIDWKKGKGNQTHVIIKPPKEWHISCGSGTSHAPNPHTGCGVGGTHDAGHKRSNKKEEEIVCPNRGISPSEDISCSADGEAKSLARPYSPRGYKQLEFDRLIASNPWLKKIVNTPWGAYEDGDAETKMQEIFDEFGIV